MADQGYPLRKSCWRDVRQQGDIITFKPESKEFLLRAQALHQ